MYVFIRFAEGRSLAAASAKAVSCGTRAVRSSGPPSTCAIMYTAIPAMKIHSIKSLGVELNREYFCTAFT